MSSTPVNVEPGEGIQIDDGNGAIRVIVADTQAIFRAGLRKIFALEDDIRVVGQAENLAQTVAAIQKFSADIVIFEAALNAEPLDTVSDLLRQAPGCRLVVVLQEPEQEMTLQLFRRGVHAVVSKEVQPELLVECLRKVAQGEPWLEPHAIAWVLDAYRTQGAGPVGARPKVQLTPKESLIVSCVTQGMKNKEIALRVGTTEQVVKNYLRKVYDKLGVADRLELALYCLNHRAAEKDKDKADDGSAKNTSADGQAPQVVAIPNASAASAGTRA
jgi:DNA-binding NarL/FixJ family response regulator